MDSLPAQGIALTRFSCSKKGLGVKVVGEVGTKFQNKDTKRIYFRFSLGPGKLEKRTSVLVVESNDADATIIQRLLEHDLPYLSVAVVDDAQGYATALVERGFSAVIVSNELSWAKGADLVRSFRLNNPELPVVLLGQALTSEMLIEAQLNGTRACLPKDSAGLLALTRLLGAALPPPEPESEAEPQPPSDDQPPRAASTARPERDTPQPATEAERYREEYQQFLYAVSHDLQEPLQLSARYANLLLHDHGEELAPHGRQILNNLVTSSQRAQAMLDDLLTFTRLGFRDADHAPVDLNTLVGEILDTYQTQLNDIGADVVVHQLPTVRGDRLQLSRVLQNLIGNAIKFRGDQPLQLQIGARDEADQWRIAVKDNGIGIDSEQLERIFGMFQRLHTTAEFPGNGMGLAICKRIVENHGGRIWARSWPNKGSSFYFTLPKTTEPT